MAVIGIGVDICDIARFAAMLERTPAVADRLFAPNERAGLRVEQLAARFAAKEAVAKALGVRYAGSWSEVTVLGGGDTRPTLGITGRVADVAAEQGIVHWHLSLSHDAGIATAFVLAES